MKHKGVNNGIVGRDHNYGYNGIEESNELGNNMLEMDLRQYDPAIARWVVLDPVVHHDFSPYQAFDNNPIVFADPSGADGEMTIQDFDGNSHTISSSDYTTVYNASGSEEDCGCDCPNPPCLPPGVTPLIGEGGFVSDEGMIGDGNTIKDINSSTKKIKTVSKEENDTNVKEPLSILAKGIALSAMGFSYHDAKLLDKYSDSWKYLRAVEEGVERTKALRMLGRFAGGITIAFDYEKYRSGEISESEFVNNSTWTGIGIFGSGYGFIVSSLYYVRGDLMGGHQQAKSMVDAVKKIRKNGERMMDRRTRRIKIIRPLFPGSCFVAGTKVLMSDGSEKNIENINVGDRIMSVDITTMKIEEDLVVKIPDYSKKYRIIIGSFDNGVTNKFSPAHPYYVKGKGWCVFDIREAETELEFAAKQLEVGDIVYFYENGVLKETKILSLFDTKNTVEMYNVEFVKKNHTFFANKILVHNKRID